MSIVRAISCLNPLLAASVLWAGSVLSDSAEPQAVQALVPVRMVNGCPDLGGLGLDYNHYVVRNPAVRRNLEALRCGLTLEGYPPGLVDVVVSGGESYIGADGGVYSLTSGAPISQRRLDSAHNLEAGARAVDLLRTGNLDDARFYAVMNKYTDFRSPRGHGEHHRHLRLGSAYACPKTICRLGSDG